MPYENSLKVIVVEQDNEYTTFRNQRGEDLDVNHEPSEGLCVIEIDTNSQDHTYFGLDVTATKRLIEVLNTNLKEME